jgi:endonuclease/exonuclease/phosphatase family metal-dependent hydrolase
VRNSTIGLIAAIVVIGGYFFSQNFSLVGLENLKVKPRAKTGSEHGNGATTISTNAPPVVRNGKTIRIATFNIQVFGRSKISKPIVVDILARITRHFDVIAIQEIRAKDQDILPLFVEAINNGGRQYDYVIGPRLGRSSSKEQYAFVFDRASIEVDRQQLFTIDDRRNDLLHREPFVGWFRVRGPPASQGFTFSLVNIHTDPDEVAEEIGVLDDVMRAVRDDGRNEDDVILLGDFNADDRHFGELGRMPQIAWAISGVPTNTRNTKQYDNLVFFANATQEFTGRTGVFDFMREYNLTIDQALEVSDHLPVWAEFSIYEGGEIGRVATRPTDSSR